MTRSAFFAGVAAAVGLGLSAHAQMIGPSPAGGPGATMDFITRASQSDEFERQEGRLAGQRAKNPMVRAFAQRMVRDHTMTTQGLKAAIRQAGMRPPPPPQLTADQRNMLRQLMATNGRGFDKVYIDQQVNAHQNALQLMNGFAQGGGPRPLRQAAAKTAPMVQHHLDMARQMQARMR